MPSPRRPSRVCVRQGRPVGRRSRAAVALAAAAVLLLGMGGCTDGAGGTDTSDEVGTASGPDRPEVSETPEQRDGSGAAGGSARTERPRDPGVVTEAQADRLLDRYQERRNAAEARRDPHLLATAEAGNALERTRAGYTGYRALPPRERAAFGRPSVYRERAFHIPAGTTWFLATARAEGARGWSVFVFDKRHGAWRVRAALELQDGGLPPPAKDREGHAVPVPPDTRSGPLRPLDVPAVYEDLWETGGTGQKSAAAPLKPNAVTREALSTYRHRDDALGERGARKRFVPVPPRHKETYALRTADGGVLALVPVAHEQRLRVTRPGLQLTPSAEEAVHAPEPRPAITSTFHGQALAHLPPHGPVTLLAAKYALVDSR